MSYCRFSCDMAGVHVARWQNGITLPRPVWSSKAPICVNRVAGGGGRFHSRPSIYFSKFKAFQGFQGPVVYTYQASAKKAHMRVHRRVDTGTLLRDRRQPWFGWCPLSATEDSPRSSWSASDLRRSSLNQRRRDRHEVLATWCPCNRYVHSPYTFV